MLKIASTPVLHINSQLANERWQKSLAIFELSLQMWRDNPALPKKSGRRVEEFMMPIEAARLQHLHDLS